MRIAKRESILLRSKIEHHAVLHACEYLEREGFEVTYLEPDETGMISLDDVKKSLQG